MIKAMLISVFMILVLGYAEFFEIRLIPFVLLFMLSLVFFEILNSNFKVVKDTSLFVFFVIVLFVFILSFYGGSHDFFAALMVFFITAYWPLFVQLKEPARTLENLIKVYVYAALLSAFGLLLQAYLFKTSGVIFGKTDLYGGGRLAFAFLWQDYSFLSLYFISCIPLILSGSFNKSLKFNFFVIFILTVASLVTTARTGVASLLIVCSLYGFLNFKRTMLDKKFYYLIFSSMVLVVIYLFVNESFVFFERDLTTSSSGRFDGYIAGLEYFLNNPFFGTYFNPLSYKEAIGTIPHNLFVYLSVVGGLFLLFFVSVWLTIFLIRSYRFKSKYIMYSFLMCIIGFQFIPSVFSGYFFAVIISMILIGNRYKVAL